MDNVRKHNNCFNRHKFLDHINSRSVCQEILSSPYGIKEVHDQIHAVLIRSSDLGPSLCAPSCLSCLYLPKFFHIFHAYHMSLTSNTIFLTVACLMTLSTIADYAA
jgi:hypothetical protein